jgi:starvation-inducible outer membrane lipoprotein
MRALVKNLILLFALLLGGCVLVPYPVSPEVEETEELPLRTDTIVLSLEPRELRDGSVRLPP